MKTILFLLLIITIVGIVAYIYFCQEQEKFIPKNKYEGALNEAYQNRQTWIKRFNSNLNNSYPTLAALINFKRLSLFLSTFGVALLIAMLSIGFVYDAAFPFIVMLLILSSPASLPMFPGGLMAVITQTYNDSAFGIFPLVVGWFTYIIIFLIGAFAKNRSVFVFIYFTFILLLIMNIVGCAKITPEFLSGIN